MKSINKKNQKKKKRRDKTLLDTRLYLNQPTTEETETPSDSY